MSSPWPEPDPEVRVAMCCLCFEGKSYDELSLTPEGELVDVCIPCRMAEIYMVIVSSKGS